MYRMLVDPDLPDDLDLHHTCRHAWCVNPWHLTPMTSSEHALLYAPEPRARKDTCVNGHDLTDPANVFITTRRSGPRAGKTERHCRLCMAEWKRRKRAAARAAAPGGAERH